MSEIRNILVVGGGTAGWMSACFLQRQLDKIRPGHYSISLVESADIGIIGVGEATVPTLLNTLKLLGIPELEFMQKCKATFKHGIKFVDWLHQPGTDDNYYYHPFARPGGVQGLDLIQYWQALYGPGRASEYAPAMTIQVALCENNRCPKLPDSKQFDAPITYAYHLDAVLLGQLLREKSIERGVTRIVDTVTSVEQHDDGRIKSVGTASGQVIEADLFIDCSGFRGLLVGKMPQAEFVSYEKQLFCDRAVALQVPLDSDEAIKPYTTSTAKRNGWIWDIDLQERHGIGYVYSSQHTTESEAEEELRQYIGARAEDINARHLRMRVGRNELQWNQNVVAVGLSAGFIEPLESSGIYLIEMALRLLVDFFPHHGLQQPLSQRFNQHINGLYDETMNFITMHYILTQREDSSFWRDNKFNQNIPGNLMEDLEMWQHRLPTPFDRGGYLNFFNHETYQYVLAGMDKLPADTRSIYSEKLLDLGRKEFELIKTMSEKAVALSPDHRQYLELLRNTAPAKPQ